MTVASAPRLIPVIRKRSHDLIYGEMHALIEYYFANGHTETARDLLATLEEWEQR